MGYHRHGLTKRTLITYFSGMKIDPKYVFLHAFFLICLSCSFQNLSYPQTIIPIQLTLLGVHGLSQSFSKAVVLTIAVKVWACFNTLIPSQIELLVGTERLSWG